MLLGCSGSEKLEELDGTIKLKGTVINKSDTTFLFMEEFVELNEALTVDEAYEKYESTFYLFSFQKDNLAGIRVGDKVVVWAPDEFLDAEPRSGTAERVEVLE